MLVFARRLGIALACAAALATVDGATAFAVGEKDGNSGTVTTSAPSQHSLGQLFTELDQAQRARAVLVDIARGYRVNIEVCFPS